MLQRFLTRGSIVLHSTGGDDRGGGGMDRRGSEWDWLPNQPQSRRLSESMFSRRFSFGLPLNSLLGPSSTRSSFSTPTPSGSGDHFRSFRRSSFMTMLGGIDTRALSRVVRKAGDWEFDVSTLKLRPLRGVANSKLPVVRLLLLLLLLLLTGVCLGPLNHEQPITVHVPNCIPQAKSLGKVCLQFTSRQ